MCICKICQDKQFVFDEKRNIYKKCICKVVKGYVLNKMCNTYI